MLKQYLQLLIISIVMVSAGKLHAVAGTPAIDSANTETCVVDPDSDEFVKAYLLIATPGKAVYQSVGHAAIRMQCPSHGLDLVFSFETDIAGGLVGQFSGKSHGKMCVTDPTHYLEPFRNEGRGVMAFQLNLTPAEKRELWRNLDDMLAENEGAFNLRYRGCMTQALKAINRAISPKSLCHSASEMFSLKNGDYADAIIKPHSPWSNLMIKLATASDCDTYDGIDTRLWPIAFQSQYQHIYITDHRGQKAPLIVGSPITIIQQSQDNSPLPVTPLITASFIAIVALTASVCQCTGKVRIFVNATDALLLILVTAVGMAILFITYMPNHIGGNWNWNLIAFNPIPLIAWLAWHNKKRLFKKFCLCYGVITLLYATMMPLLSTGGDSALYIVASSVALRCFCIRFCRLTDNKTSNI